MPTKAEIVRAFEIYNVCLFGGRLQLPAIMVRRMRDCARWYEPEPLRAESDHPRYAHGLLVISSTALHSMTWKATLLHELVHMIVPVEENDHHGALFTGECNRVGALIGLEPVEIEDSWCWPSHHLNIEEDDGNILEDICDELKPFLPKPKKTPKKTERVSFDLETALIVPGVQAPPISVLGFKLASERKVHRIMAKDPAFKPFVRSMFEEKSLLMTAHHLRFDVACLMAHEPEWAPIIFDKFNQNGFSCSLIRETLAWIAKANPFDTKRKFDLGTCYAKTAKGKLPVDKEDPWRLKWGLLADLPLSVIQQIAPEALAYLDIDVLAQDELWVAQQDQHSLWLLDEYRQVRASYALYLAQCWGVQTDPAQVEALHDVTKKALDEAADLCKAEGLVREDGSRDTAKAAERQERAYARLGLPVPRGEPTFKMRQKAHTQELKRLLATGMAEEVAEELAAECAKNLLGNVVLDEDACTDSQDPLMDAYCKTGQSSLLLGKVRRLRRGLIQASYNTLVNTGRTSCRQGKDPKKGEAPSAHGSQMQNPPREVLIDCPSCHGTGKLDGVVCIPCAGLGEVPTPGVRECFIARPGYVIVSIDFDAFELRTYAQCQLWMVGFSKLAAILNDPKRCPHVEMGARILNISPEDAYKVEGKPKKRMRQLAKGPNFGLPGGMGAERLVAYCFDGYGVQLKVDEKSDEGLPSAKEIIKQWHAFDPANREYLNLIGKMTREKGNRSRFIQHYSARVRGGLGYCDAANTFFQGLAADAAKESVWRVTQESYAVKSSPLYGTRMLAFVHDEGVFEMPMDGLHERCLHLQKVWCEAAQEIVPDVLISASPACAFRWSKAAGDPVYDANKRIMPYEALAGYKGLPAPPGQMERWLRALAL